MTKETNHNSEYINADYRPVRKKRTGKLLILILAFLMVVGVGVWLIRHFYLEQVSTGCKEQTSRIFEQAGTLDLGKLDKAAVPEGFASMGVTEMLLAAPEKSGDAFGQDAKSCVSAGIDQIKAQLAKDLSENAVFEIRSVKTESHLCTVQVHTQNLDFGKVMSQIAEEIGKLLKEDQEAWEKEQQEKKEIHEKAEARRKQEQEAEEKRQEEEKKRRQESGFGWWDDFTDYVGGWFGDPVEENTDKADESVTADDYDPNAVWIPAQDLISREILSIYRKAVDGVKKDKAYTSHEGAVTYVRKTATWRLQGMDPELLYNFYGIPLTYQP